MFFGLVGYLMNILLFVFLIVGLVQCRKHSFTAGFYFFLILIVYKFLSLFSTPFIRKYLDSLIEGNKSPPMGKTIGEFIMWVSLFPKVIELVAFGILVVGLYKMWRSKVASRQ